MSIPLRKDTLHQLKKVAKTPQYNIDDATASHVHIGVGAFSRAHILVFADDALALSAKKGEPLDSATIGINLKNSQSADKPSVRDTLQRQDFLYTVVEKGENISIPRIIGSIKHIMVAPENPQDAIETAADPTIKMISLTVTQKGFYLNKDETFNEKAEDIINCLDDTRPEMSAIGLIVESFALRKERELPAPLILSCDNLSGNGTKLRNALMAYAEIKYPGTKEDSLKKWISDNVQCPNTMVDRITPQTTKAHTKHLQDVGVEDGWGIQTEPKPTLPFVIEWHDMDNIPEPLKKLASIGAIIVKNVTPYEHLKVRSLNGAHMALGCIGHLLGKEFSHEAMANIHVRGFVRGFMEEAGTTLDPTERVNHDDFREDVIHRLDNKEICDQLTRLCRNGSDKVKTRINETLVDLIAQNSTSENSGPNNYAHMSFTLASWIEYMKELDSDGRFKDAPPESEPNDTGFTESGLSSLVTSDMTDPRPLFALGTLFNSDLAGSDQLQESVKGHLELINEYGMARALEIFVKAQNYAPATSNNIEKPANDIHTGQQNDYLKRHLN